MKKRSLLFTLVGLFAALWMGFVIVIVIWLSSVPTPSYESKFSDVITLTFSSGTNFSTHRSITKPIDDDLRRNELGFVSGVLGGIEIDFISIDTDFDLVNEVALVNSWITARTIPNKVEVKYEQGVYETE